MKDLAHHEYTIGFPESWTDRTDVVLVGPAEDGKSPSVTVKRIDLEVEQTLAQFAAFQRQGLENIMNVQKPDFIEEGPTALAGLQAYARVYRIRFANKALTQRQVYAIRGRTAYVITMTSAVERYEADLPIFEEILGRFQFRLPGM